MRTAIMTDSNSGIFPEIGGQMGVFVLPMPVILDGEERYEGVDLKPKEFFTSLMNGADASTSQPSPGAVLSMFEQVLSNGYDEITYIPMSSGLSSSCQTAQMLSEEYGGKVQVVDNHRISVTLYDSVLSARRMAEQGVSAREIKEKLEAASMDSVIYLGVSTLKYFKKNGRCTPAVASLGDILNIKPLLLCKGERFERCGLPRSVSACKKSLLEHAQQAAEKLRLADERLDIGAASSFADPELEEDWSALVMEAFPNDNVHYEPLSFSVACHTGPNAFGVGISRRI